MFENSTEGTGSNVKSLRRIFLFIFLASFSVIQYMVLIVFSNPFLISLLISYLLDYHFPIRTQS